MSGGKDSLSPLHVSQGIQIFSNFSLHALLKCLSKKVGSFGPTAMLIRVNIKIWLKIKTESSLELFCKQTHSGTEVVLVREGPRAGGGLLTAEKGF
jgi:hypothetical protein